MTSRVQLLACAEEWMKCNPTSGKPIYWIYTVDYPDRKAEFYVPWLGRTVAFPASGVIESASFYTIHRELDKAVRFLNTNDMAVQDGCFSGAFILLGFPEIPPFNTTETRMFFRWDEERRGFFHDEEPEVFRGIPVCQGGFSFKP